MWCDNGINCICDDGSFGNWFYIIWSNCGFIKLVLVILYCYFYCDYFYYDWDEVYLKCFRVNKVKSRLFIYFFIDIRIWWVCV